MYIYNYAIIIIATLYAVTIRCVYNVVHVSEDKEYIDNIVDEDFYTVTQVRHSDKGQLC